MGTATCRNPTQARSPRRKGDRSGIREAPRPRGGRGEKSLRRRAARDLRGPASSDRRRCRPPVLRIPPSASFVRRRRRHGPLSSGPRVSINSGGSWRSASMRTTASPFAASRPARSAAWWPKFRKIEGLGCAGFAAHSSSVSSEPSRLPSSTKTISNDPRSSSQEPQVSDPGAARDFPTRCSTE